MLLVIPMGQFQMFCFTSSQTHRAPVSEPTSSCQLRARKPVNSGQMECIPELRLAFAGFVDIADGRLIDEQGRGAAAIDLDAVAVIPLDAALHLFAVFHYDDHGRFALDLLLVIVVFSVGLLGRTVTAGDGGCTVRALKPLTAF